MSQQNKAYVLAFLAVCCWSTVATAFKLSLQYLTPLQLVFGASIFSSCVLLAVILYQKKIHALQSFVFANIWNSFGLALLNPCLYYLVLFSAYKALPAQQAMAINYSWPLMLVILSAVYLKQHLKLLELIAILVAYLGVVIVVTKGDANQLASVDLAGLLFAVGSTFIWSLYWVLTAKRKNDPVLALFFMFCISVPVLGLLTWRFSPIQAITWQGVVGAMYVGVFEMGITFLFWLSALRLSDRTASVSRLIYLTPFASLVWIAIILKEQLHSATAVGLVVVICGLLLQNLQVLNIKKY